MVNSESLVAYGIATNLRPYSGVELGADKNSITRVVLLLIVWVFACWYGVSNIVSGVHGGVAKSGLVDGGVSTYGDVVLTSYLYILLVSLPFLVFVYLAGSSHISKRRYVIHATEKQGHRIQFILRSINNLDRSILLHYCIGIYATAVASLIIVVLGVVVARLFGGGFSVINDLNNAADKVTSDRHWVYITGLIVIIIRTSLLGTFVALIATKGIAFAVKSFDQAARFTKRKHAAYFLMQMVVSDESFDIAHLRDIMASFEVWNSRVDSAYTDITAKPDASDAVFKTDEIFSVFKRR